MSHLLISNAEQILRENYNNSDMSFNFDDWVKNEADNDPAFFNWILKDGSNVNDYGSGMTKDQQDAVKDFINSL